jgi:hypothetical protein
MAGLAKRLDGWAARSRSFANTLIPVFSSPRTTSLPSTGRRFVPPRVAFGAAVSSSEGGIRGVSDPACHAPFVAPWPSWSGSLTPQTRVTFVRRDRACP